MIVNELLSYVIHCFKAGTHGNLLRILSNFYDVDEIILAKKTLWEVSKDNIDVIGEYQDRRGGSTRTAVEAHTEDILNAVKKLDAIQKFPDIVARNLDRIPDRQPEELNLLWVTQRLKKVESMLNTHNDHLTDMHIDITELKTQQKETNDTINVTNQEWQNAISQCKTKIIEYSDAVTATDMALTDHLLMKDCGNKTADNIETPATYACALLINNTGQEAEPEDQQIVGNSAPNAGFRPGSHSNDAPVRELPVLSQQKSTGINGSSVIGQKQSRPLRQPPHLFQQNYGNIRQINPQNRDNYIGGTNSRSSFRANPIRQQHQEVDNDGFTLVQRRRRIPRINGRGGATGVDGFQGAPFPLRHLWVGRIMQGNEEKLKTFLRKKNVEVSNIEKVSHERSTFKSYKVTVSVIDYHKLLNEDFWSNGIQCKKWYERKPSNVDVDLNNEVFRNDRNKDYRPRRTYDSVASNLSLHG